MVQAVEKKRKRLAPYVPASTLSAFFDHIRYVKTPDKVDSNLLQDYGIAKGQVFALLSTLKFLGLTEDDGTPTPAFNFLQTGAEEFQTNLREIIQRAYADLFSRLDVSRDSRDKILNFFARNYSPATAERATRLFLDLCGEAGIETATKEQKRKQRQGPVKQRAKPATSRTTQTVTAEQQTSEESSGSETRQDTSQSLPGVSIRIDSKDLVSMNPQQIQALFEGLSKVIKKEKPEEK
jgi:hypothetical protein